MPTIANAQTSNTSSNTESLVNDFQTVNYPITSVASEDGLSRVVIPGPGGGSGYHWWTSRTINGNFHTTFSTVTAGAALIAGIAGMPTFFFSDVAGLIITNFIDNVWYHKVIQRGTSPETGAPYLRSIIYLYSDSGHYNLIDVAYSNPVRSSI